LLGSSISFSPFILPRLPLIITWTCFFPLPIHGLPRTRSPPVIDAFASHIRSSINITKRQSTLNVGRSSDRSHDPPLREPVGDVGVLASDLL
jgi:hypothetical protein